MTENIQLNMAMGFEHKKRLGIQIKREKVNADMQSHDFFTRFWERSVFGVKPDQPSRFTLTLLNPGVLRKIIWRTSSRKQGEDHIYKEIEIKGDREVAMVLREILNSFKGKKWGSFGLRIFCYLCLYFLAPQRISIRYVCGARPLRVGETVGRSAPITICSPMFFAFGWERDTIQPAFISNPPLILDPCS